MDSPGRPRQRRSSPAWHYPTAPPALFPRAPNAELTASSRAPRPTAQQPSQFRSNASNLNSSILLSRSDVCRIDHEFRQGAAEAIMHALRQFKSVRGAEQVEVSGFVPVAHHGKTIEQRNVVLLRHHAHIIYVGSSENHGLGAWTILRIY